jgi:hypothetical protein
LGFVRNIRLLSNDAVESWISRNAAAIVNNDLVDAIVSVVNRQIGGRPVEDERMNALAEIDLRIGQAIDPDMTIDSATDLADIKDSRRRMDNDLTDHLKRRAAGKLTGKGWPNADLYHAIVDKSRQRYEAGESIDSIAHSIGDPWGVCT